MARQDFMDQAKKLGYDPIAVEENGVMFSYTIRQGKLKGQTVNIGFHVPSFPEIPPSGPHFDKELLPINAQQGPHPYFGVHHSISQGCDFKEGWQYWSRPFGDWAGSDRSVRTYMGYINYLMSLIV